MKYTNQKKIYFILRILKYYFKSFLISEILLNKKLI